MILSSVELRNYPEDEKDHFPWTLPLLKNLEEITFKKNISFFVGENGSGKSTILEAIAAKSEVVLAGSRRLEEDASLQKATELASYLRLHYDDKTRNGFFVRAEDFIGFARKIKQEIRELDHEIDDVKKNANGRDVKLTIETIEDEKKSFIKRYTRDLEELSHGEGFLKFFTSRITGKGLYLIDEPEAALSPARQLSLLSLIMQKVKETGSHFIIATHSPIMMSAPDSEILYFKEESISTVDYKETEHYKLTKSILDRPEQIMNLL